MRPREVTLGTVMGCGRLRPLKAGQEHPTALEDLIGLRIIGRQAAQGSPRRYHDHADPQPNHPVVHAHAFASEGPRPRSAEERPSVMAATGTFGPSDVEPSRCYGRARHGTNVRIGIMKRLRPDEAAIPRWLRTSVREARFAGDRDRRRDWH